MRVLGMMVHNGGSARRGGLRFGIRMGLVVATACVGVNLTPVAPLAPSASAATARASATAGRHTANPASGTSPRATRALICDPRPPEYAGCSAEQVRPLLRDTFANEYRGHASGYRYHRMGQHRRGVIFAHLSRPLNAKLARLYSAAVRRYAQAHKVSRVDQHGVTHVTTEYPRYRTWAGFRAQATSFCNGTNITVHFPTQYCWSITKLGQAGRVIARLLNSTLRIAFACNGYAVGGFASGGFAAWKLGTGVLSGGFYGGVGVEIGCQTTHLWNWVTSLW
jgi:hypothetical protein